MTDVVVDASVVIAYLRRESGWASLEGYLVGRCLISTVNLAEVIGKLREKGVDPAAVNVILEQLSLTVVPFDEFQARRAGELRVATRSRGLSLGDRACLALAGMRAVPAITTDSAWAALDVGIEVQVMR